MVDGELNNSSVVSTIGLVAVPDVDNKVQRVLEFYDEEIVGICWIVGRGIGHDAHDAEWACGKVGLCGAAYLPKGCCGRVGNVAGHCSAAESDGNVAARHAVVNMLGMQFQSEGERECDGYCETV